MPTYIRGARLHISDCVAIFVRSEQPREVEAFMKLNPVRLPSFEPRSMEAAINETLTKRSKEVMVRPPYLPLRPVCAYYEENDKLFTTSFTEHRNTRIIADKGRKIPLTSSNLFYATYKHRTWGGLVEGRGLGRRTFVSTAAHLEPGVFVLDGATVDSLTILRDGTVIAGKDTWVHRNERNETVIERVPRELRGTHRC
jgi:hypothetical protein